MNGDLNPGAGWASSVIQLSSTDGLLETIGTNEM
ncbi:hypothetical protein A1E_05225 [Rickettsia canadensis str. McKiel]|uniref:Uncharacterized protein n=1 Tax=Rickettsia canadensis (strain McKiel) TaxID=293613 RepID=A8F028_RICCK|nr:hypothetical protein A1E_05225 [Rickettsia canadensis str. McKiel]